MTSLTSLSIRVSRSRTGALLCTALAVAGVIAGALALLAAMGDVRAKVLGLRIVVASPLRPALVAALCFCALFGLRWVRAPRPLWRRAGTAACAVAVFLVATVWVRTLPEIASDGDISATSLRTMRLLEGRQFTGMYSRLGWDHPGPAVFAALAPLYRATGYRERSHAVSAIAINVLAIAGLFSCLRRPAAKVALALALGVYIARVPGLIASAWTPLILVLPLMLYVGICAQLASGRIRRLPVVVILGSALTQTHVGVSLAVTTVFGASALLAWRCAPLPVAADEWRRALRLSAWALAAMWFLPLAEQLTSDHGNMSRIGRFLIAPGEDRVEALAAAGAFATQFAGPLLPGFRLAEGWPADTPTSMVPGLASAVILVLLGVLLAVRIRRREWCDEAALGVLTMTGSIAALVSITRIAGGVADHLVFWTSAFGMLALATLATALVGMVTRSDTRWMPRLAVALTLAAVLVSGVVTVNSTRDYHSPLIRSAFTAMRDHLSSKGLSHPRVGSSQDRWGEAVGAVLLLRKAGIDVTVTRELDLIVGDGVVKADTDVVFRIVDRTARAAMEQTGEWTRLETYRHETDVYARPATSQDLATELADSRASYR
jgi:hypothetical protein